MSLSAVKWLLRAAIAVAVAMFAAAASAAFTRDQSFALFLGGCCLVVVAILWYRRAVPGAQTREQVRQARQLLALKQQLRHTGEPVTVKTPGHLLMVVLCACMVAKLRTIDASDEAARRRLMETYVDEHAREMKVRLALFAVLLAALLVAGLVLFGG